MPAKRKAEEILVDRSAKSKKVTRSSARTKPKTTIPKLNPTAESSKSALRGKDRDESEDEIIEVAQPGSSPWRESLSTGPRLVTSPLVQNPKQMAKIRDSGHEV